MLLVLLIHTFSILSVQLNKLRLFGYDSITVSSAWELTSVSMRYSQGEGVNTSLARFMYCTHDKSCIVFGGSSVMFLCGVHGYP